MYKFFIIVILFITVFYACGKKDVDSNLIEKKDFQWTDNLSIDKIPDFPLKGMINGKEFKPEYINFEKWRGSGDNVINFSNKKPLQNCGFIEKNDAFFIMRANGDFEEGNFIKSTFSANIDNYSADFHYETSEGTKSENVQWNCALVITEIGDKIVKGKIALCFNDLSKSWVAGKFEAIRCNN